MNITLTIFYFILILLFLFWVNKKKTSLPNFTLPIAFIVKVGFGLFFLYVYTYHYGGGELTADAGRFFKESKTLFSVFHQSPTDFFKFIFGVNNDPQLIQHYLDSTSHWNGGDQLLPNDSRNVIRINALLLFISNGEVLIHFLFFSLASFWGGFELFQWLKKKETRFPILLLFLLTLAPSIAFWSSSIIKEPLMILGLCLVLRGIFDSLSPAKRIWRILIGICLTLMFKPYVGILLLVALVYYFLFSRLFRLQLLSFLTFIIFLIGLLYFTNSLDRFTYIISNQQEDFMNVRDGGLYLDGDEEHFYYIYFENRNHFEFKDGYAILKEPVGAYYMKKQENYERFSMRLDQVGRKYPIYLSMTKAGSGLEVTPIKDSFKQLVMNVPEALYHSFLQPIPNRKSSWLQYPAFFENILYIVLAIISFFIIPKRNSLNDRRIIATLLFFALSVGLIVGWTTPVSGAIVRYIIPAQVALLVAFILQIDSKKIPLKRIKHKS